MFKVLNKHYSRLTRNSTDLMFQQVHWLMHAHFWLHGTLWLSHLLCVCVSRSGEDAATTWGALLDQPLDQTTQHARDTLHKHTV